MRALFVLSASFATALILAGCSQSSTSSVTATPIKSGTVCVDIPDVDLFTVVDGKFRPASATTVMLPVLEIPALVKGLGFDWMRAERTGDVVIVRGIAPDADARALGFEAAETAIRAHPDFQSGAITRIDDRVSAANPEAVNLQKRMTETFDELGLSWMSLDVRGEVATLSGLAPRPEIKDAAYQAGRLAIQQDPEAIEVITVIVDSISVENETHAPGQVLTGLPLAPTRDECQQALVDVMQDHDVEFELNQAVISSSSARLLDAVVGITLICEDYTIDIGGHTDARGSDNYNLILSRERADSVRLYLIDKGVAPARLTATGYGETQPLDPAMTNQAYQKNRRTEFNIVER